MIRRAFLFAIVAVRLTAQQSSAAEPQGVAAAWDVRTQLTALANAIREIEPLVQRVDPRILSENGAPAAYVQQVLSVQASMKSLLSAADQLAREPEKLPVAVDVYFQMERMELLLNSLRDGLKKYQSPDLADMLSQTLGKNAIHRDRLRQHIRDVAELHDEEYKIANEEAQRCRGILTKQPATTPVPRKPSPVPSNSKNPVPSPSQPPRSRK
ncbi:MAG: hypothetical protein SGI92_20830 [Bryobacteraceae bacterium]|nr:hypothetical protein [Bryobacteraceae bacterium]